MRKILRRSASPALVGLGAFLLMAAVLVRFYAYPTLSTVPTNFESDTALQGDGVTIFDSGEQGTREANLAFLSHTVSISGADAPDGVDVWSNRLSITDTDVPDATCGGDQAGCFQQSSEVSAFDGKTGAGVECDTCDASVDVLNYKNLQPVTIPLDGSTYDGAQIYKFPFGTEKKDYQNYDTTLGAATTATYVGETEIDGLEVYKFEQKIEPTDITDLHPEVSSVTLAGSLFGSDETAVSPRVMYGMDRTLYVEPTTGTIVNRIDERNQYFELDGQQLPALVGEIRYTDDEVADSVSDAKGQAFLLGGMKLLFPLLFAVLGLAAISAGLVLRRKSGEPTVEKRDGELVGA